MGLLDILGGGQIGLIGGAIGALGGLFGGSQNKSYGSSGDLSAGRGQLGQLGQLGNQYGDIARQDMGAYGSANNQYQSALQGQENYLKADPYTDQYSTAQLANAASGTASAYQRAHANLQASMGANGMGGGNSSMLAGGEAGIEAGQAGTIAQDQNNLAMNRIGQRAQNLSALTNLSGGVANTDYSRGMGAMGAQEGVNQNLANSYLGLGQSELGMEQNYQAQQRQAMASGLGGLGQAVGMASYYANQKQNAALSNQPAGYGGGGYYGGGYYGGGVQPDNPYGLGNGTGFGL